MNINYERASAASGASSFVFKGKIWAFAARPDPTRPDPITLFKALYLRNRMSDRQAVFFDEYHLDVKCCMAWLPYSVSWTKNLIEQYNNLIVWDYRSLVWANIDCNYKLHFLTFWSISAKKSLLLCHVGITLETFENLVKSRSSMATPRYKIGKK